MGFHVSQWLWSWLLRIKFHTLNISISGCWIPFFQEVNFPSTQLLFPSGTNLELYHIIFLKLLISPYYLSENFIFCLWYLQHPALEDLILDSSWISMFHWYCLELPILKCVVFDSSLRLLLSSDIYIYIFFIFWLVLLGLYQQVSKSQTRLSDFTFTFHFHALEKEMATHSSVLAWRMPGMGEPGGLLSLGSHRIGHD